jgi:hypothetical protein
LIVIFIFFRSEKVSFQPKSDNNNLPPVADSKASASSSPRLVSTYDQVANIAIAELENLSLSLENGQPAGLLLLTASSSLEKIHLSFSKERVPTKYKDFHLLFSRSLLKFSSYLEKSDLKEIAEGRKLLEEAKNEYNQISAESSL